MKSTSVIPGTPKVAACVTCLGAAALLALAGGTRAANFTTTVQQGVGANWNGAIWQPGGVSPTVGNTYEATAGGNPTRLRNPATAAVQTFPGDSLTLDAGSEIRAKQPGATLDFPGVGGNAGLILNGGNMDTGDNSVFPVTGSILVQANSSFSCGDTGGNNTRGWQIGASISGSGNLLVVKTFGGGVNAMEVTSVNNPYSGNWTVTSGGFKGTGSGSLGSGSITIAPTNASINPVVFEVNYDLTSSGGLILTNGGQMNLHQVCSFTNVMIETTTLSAGLHTYDELIANFPANFVPGGSGSISVQPPAPPCTPTNITVINGDSQVILSWSPACNAASYFVKRSLTSGSGYVVVGTLSAPTFTDSPLLNGGTYYYVISATNALGESANSVEVVGKPNIPVTGLTATAGTNQISLNWNALVGASSYRVQRGVVSGGPYTNVATGVTTTSYIDTGLPSGKTFFYTVVASLLGGESGISNEATATTTPGTPTNVTAVLFAATVIRLGWTNSDPVRPQYSIEQSTDNVNFTPLATQPPAPPSYTNTGLSLGTTYFYRIQAQNASGLSDYSIVVSNTTPTFGINVNFELAGTPVPPGYIPDGGSVFADRGNGYSYGWDRDITADARYRATTIAPDLRYDTFVHLEKAFATLGAATWEIAIPNGFYWVHIVAGDAGGATDAKYQFNVEGNLTFPIYTPVAPTLWIEYTNTVVVNDGRLTVTSGPISVTRTNNKIDFIDIYPAVAIPIVIATNPAPNTTVEENRLLTLNVAVAPVRAPVTPYEGYLPVAYQWYKDSGAGYAPVMDQTNATLSIALAQLSDAGDYVAVATNFAGPVTSLVAHVTVTVDSAPPVIVSAGSADGTEVGICFDEFVRDGVPTTDNFTYQIYDEMTQVNSSDIVTPAFVTLRADGKSVRLYSLSRPIVGAFMVTTDQGGGVPDLKGNAAAQSGAGQVSGLTHAPVGYDPSALPGYPTNTVYTCKDGDFEVTAGGVDIWGTIDQGDLLLLPRSGDFEAVVQIGGLTISDSVVPNIAKAGLMVRQSFDSNSPTLYLSVNPPGPNGRDLGEAGARTAIGGGTAAWAPIETNYVPVGIPNAWQRLTRVGNVFTAYRSSNGVDWVIFAKTTQVFTDPVLLGLATTAHSTTNGITIAQYRNFHVGSSVVVVSPVITHGSGVYSGGTFSATFSTQAGVNYAVEYTDSLSPKNYHTLTTISGDGTIKPFTDPGPLPPATRFYRIHVVP